MGAYCEAKQKGEQLNVAGKKRNEVFHALWDDVEAVSDDVEECEDETCEGKLGDDA